MQVQSYLFFGGRCEEAIDFYRTAIDAKLDLLMRHSDRPSPAPPGMLADNWQSKVMHASFRIGDTTIMGSDGQGFEKPSCKGFTLSLNVQTPTEADRYFSALAEGGQVTMPIGQTFWSPRFGMLTDRFGIGWMVNCVTPS